MNFTTLSCLVFRNFFFFLKYIPYKNTTKVYLKHILHLEKKNIPIYKIINNFILVIYYSIFYNILKLII